MKKLLTLLIGLLIAGCLSAQFSNSYTYPFFIGKAGTSTGSITLYGITSGTAQLKIPDIAGVGTIFQLPATNGTSGYVLRTDGAGVLTWISLTGYAPLASPTFTGTVVLPSATSIGTVTNTEIGYLDNVTSAIQTQFTGKVNVSDTVTMLTPYITTIETRDEIADSLNALRDAGIDGSTLYVKLLPDTTHVDAATYTPIVGDQEVYCDNDFTAIELPLNATQAIPIGTTINFFGRGGIMKFTVEGGGHLIAPLDSTATAYAGDVVGAKKEGTNKWWVFGPLRD